MAGAALAGELSATGSRTEFAVATPAEEAELRAFLRRAPTPGVVSLRFEREPHYFIGEGLAGARDTTIVARREERLVCVGRCSRRVVYIGGARREAGYLSELRLAPGIRGGLGVLREGYAFFARHEALRPEGPADFYFTSVAETNVRARAVLESGRLGLPRYEPCAALCTVAWPPRRRGGRAWRAEPVGGEDLVRFWDEQARRHALTTPWARGSWATLGGHGLGEADFCVVRREGRIVAAGAVWDQGAWRQTVVAGYAGWLRWGRGLINVMSRVAGRAGLPAAGERLRQACVHPLAVAEHASEKELEELLARLEQRAAERGVEWLVASVAAEDGLRARLRARGGAREYATRLHTVRLSGLTDGWRGLDGQRVRPEAGFL